ncbi:MULTISPECIES: hypothetical protein [Vibrio]|uniref:hypothetical protein n=1 Tax=Vibrio TaxID=662 RepID=UPI00207500BD|nr:MULTISPECIES: hypothetical protein [Vibrio]USD35608.1 hypothetical protein J8Z27_22635 [Vibrio sp. SCSIO 43186]USD72732.1 hypothetical protein J4N41_22640 [Vibrio sp. SCSIO 43139]USD98937.1 hypothetical protein CTT30_22960 [Vibrio coralliilyticus]
MSDKTYSLRALYLGTSDDGVKVQSPFLENCDVQDTLDAFKKDSIPKDTAPFFIDLWEDEESTLVETIGVSEDTYKRITGEEVLTYSDYEQAHQLREDAIFGAMQEVLREKGIEVPVNPASEQFDAALAVHRFKKKDHVLVDVNVDDLQLDNGERV